MPSPIHQVPTSHHSCPYTYRHHCCCCCCCSCSHSRCCSCRCKIRRWPTARVKPSFSSFFFCSFFVSSILLGFCPTFLVCSQSTASEAGPGQGAPRGHSRQSVLVQPAALAQVKRPVAGAAVAAAAGRIFLLVFHRRTFFAAVHRALRPPPPSHPDSRSGEDSYSLLPLHEGYSLD